MDLFWRLQPDYWEGGPNNASRPAAQKLSWESYSYLLRGGGMVLRGWGARVCARSTSRTGGMGRARRSHPGDRCSITTASHPCPVAAARRSIRLLRACHRPLCLVGLARSALCAAAAGRCVPPPPPLCATATAATVCHHRHRCPADTFWLSCCCCCLPLRSGSITDARITSRRPAPSFWTS